MTNKIVGVLITLATIVFLLFTPVLTTMFSNNLYQQFYSDDFPTTKADQEFLTELVLEYIRGIDVSMIPFTSEEVAHLQDVRSLVGIGEELVVVSGLILLIFIPLTWWRKRNYKLALKPVFVGSIIVFVIALTIAIIGYFAFESIFIVFHKIFFPQGGWQFASNSLLIILFPINVFSTLAERIVFITLGMSGALSLLTWFSLYRLRSNN